MKNKVKLIAKYVSLVLFSILLVLSVVLTIVGSFYLDFYSFETMQRFVDSGGNSPFGERQFELMNEFILIALTISISLALVSILVIFILNLDGIKNAFLWLTGSFFVVSATDFALVFYVLAYTSSLIDYGGDFNIYAAEVLSSYLPSLNSLGLLFFALSLTSLLSYFAGKYFKK